MKSIRQSADAVREINLTVHGITVAYNGHPVLDDFTLEIVPGDFLAILGPNGCGKSTLLRTMLGYLKPGGGIVLLGGEDLRTMSSQARARTMAAVRQEDESSFEFTVEDVVAMGRTPHLKGFGLMTGQDRRMVEGAMRATDVERFRDRLITEVSGGERRRVMIARALAQEPKLMLLDEPTSNLDLSYQYEMLALLRRLNRNSGLTVVLAMHQINLAATAAKKVLLMARRGTIHALGKPEEVITQENIEAVYGTRVMVVPHPISRRPQVVPTYDFEA